MQPFTVRDERGLTHPVGGDCTVCMTGWPVPCSRIIDRAIKPVHFDTEGQATAYDWSVTRCPGFVHAEVGESGAIETRCEACGVPP